MIVQILAFYVVMSSSSPLNDKISCLMISNKLYPIYHLWTDESPDFIFSDLVIPNEFLTIPSFNPQWTLIFDWLYHVLNHLIILVTFVISSEIQLDEFLTFF